MKKLMPILVKFSGVIAAIAFMVVTVSANSCCTYIYNQPKAPKGLDDYKKFWFAIPMYII